MVLGHSSLITAQYTTDGSLRVEFSSSEAFAQASATWSVGGGLILVVNGEGCAAMKNDRCYYNCQGLEIDEVNQVIVAFGWAQDSESLSVRGEAEWGYWKPQADNPLCSPGQFGLEGETLKPGDSGSKSGSNPCSGGSNTDSGNPSPIFFDKLDGCHDNSVPKVFAKFIQKFKAWPKVVVFFHMRVLSLPSVPPSERYVITRVREIPSCYRLTLRHGYMDDVLTPNLEQKIMHELMLFITRGDPSQSETDDVDDAAWRFDNQDLSPKIREEMNVLRQAKDTQAVYAMGKQVLRIGQGQSRNPIARLVRRLGLEAFLWIRENSRAKLADLDVDYDNLIEVGFIKEM